MPRAPLTLETADNRTGTHDHLDRDSHHQHDDDNVPYFDIYQ